MVALIVSVACIISLAGGFTLGLLTYAHVYQHFKASIESVIHRKVSIERQRETINKAILEQTRARLVEQYGSDLSKRHQEIMNEELASALTRPQGGNGER